VYPAKLREIVGERLDRNRREEAADPGDWEWITASAKTFSNLFLSSTSISTSMTCASLYESIASSSTPSPAARDALTWATGLSPPLVRRSEARATGEATLEQLARAIESERLAVAA
jgi:hypothetical protein